MEQPGNPQKIRKGHRVALNQDLTAHDASIVITPAGTKGTVQRVVRGMAFVHFDNAKPAHQVWAWKLDRLAKQKEVA